MKYIHNKTRHFPPGRFVCFAGPENFGAREQQATSEMKATIESLEKGFETKDPNEVARDAIAKINAIEKGHEQWYLNNKNLLSERGNQYQEKIYALGNWAREEIRIHKDNFEFRKK